MSLSLCCRRRRASRAFISYIHTYIHMGDCPPQFTCVPTPYIVLSIIKWPLNARLMYAFACAAPSCQRRWMYVRACNRVRVRLSVGAKLYVSLLSCNQRSPCHPKRIAAQEWLSVGADRRHFLTNSKLFWTNPTGPNVNFKWPRNRVSNNQC